MADVGPRLVKFGLLCILVMLFASVSLQGCSDTQISDKTTQDKSKALEAVAKKLAPQDAGKVER